MGIDIYLHLEVRGDQGNWQLVPEPIYFFPWNTLGTARCFDQSLLTEYERGSKKLPIDLPWSPADFKAVHGGFDREKWWRLNHPFELAGCRNYSLFAILAGVGGGSSLSDCSYVEHFVPICPARGLPSDISLELAGQLSNCSKSQYSHSYLTLEELLAYDWERIVVRKGFIGIFEYVRWVKSGAKERGKGPSSWSGISPNGDGALLSLEEMDRCVRECGLFEAFSVNSGGSSAGIVNLPRPTDDAIYTEISWEESYQKSACQFYSKFLPWLKTLGVSADRIRIVFFFDD